LMVFLSMSLINTEYDLHMLVRVIALSLGFLALKGGIFVLITGGNYMVWGPDRSFLTSNTAFGLALSMNIPLLYYLMKIETNAWLRWIMLAELVLSYPAILGTYSRGAWLASGIVTSLILIKSKHKLLVLPMVYVLAISVQPYLTQILPQRAFARYDDLVNY